MYGQNWLGSPTLLEAVAGIEENLDNAQINQVDAQDHLQDATQTNPENKGNPHQ